VCISAAVGALAANRVDDVKTIQVLLNLNRPTPYRLLGVDGICGRGTVDAIFEFQQRVMEMDQPDTRVDPNGQTLRELKKAIPASFSMAHLQGIALDANAAQINRFAAPLEFQMPRYNINTPLRQAHFLAQVCHESGQLRYTEELASGDAYEGRVRGLGNTQPGDGRRFKGRGLIQLTGRANYQAFGRAVNRDFLTDPNQRLLATDPDLATQVACWFWSEHNLNGPADANNIRDITTTINGGLNGFADRQALFARAQCMFNLH
jgi:putative chitinase